MWTSLYYGNWDYWNLRHKVTFDGVNKLILINNGETSIDVQRDIYSSWKEWDLLETNTRYLPALNTVGGEPTIAGQKLDVTYFLINGWRIKPYPGSYDLNIVGNLFEVNGGSIKVQADIIKSIPNNISVSTNTSVIVRQVNGATTGGLTVDQDAALFNIEGVVLSIQNTLASPISATLIPSQSDALYNIEAKLMELWQLHGLDDTSPLTVNLNNRTAGDIVQTIITTGNGATQETVITREWV